MNKIETIRKAMNNAPRYYYHGKFRRMDEEHWDRVEWLLEVVEAQGILFSKAHGMLRSAEWEKEYKAHLAQFPEEE